VDDDAATRELLSRYLAENGIKVTAVADREAMQAALDSEVIDLVLLGQRSSHDGIEFAGQLLGKCAAPIVMLSHLTDEADRVMALELGADDYVTKPFSPRELLARVRAILRRRQRPLRQARAPGVRAYRFDGWELSLLRRRLKSPQNRWVTLTKGEFNLLVVLLQANERLVSRTQIIELSRLHRDDVDDRAVDCQILRLRRKLGDDSGNPRCILTVRGFGYRIGVRVESVY
jgi:DNA-binding response OmpR family regulator